MITKDSVFAQAGQQDPNKTEANFREGMIPNTVAMAEDVNTYGNWSDRDLKVVCDEIVNALKANGITPNNSYTPGDSNQLSEMIATKLQSGFMLTGIDYSTLTQEPVQSADGSTISFTEFDVVFNLGIYFGNTKSQFARATVATQELTATNDANGVQYIYANRQGGLEIKTTGPVLGSEGAEKCMLGSAFAINGVFQQGSWKFQPWLQGTSLERRESPTASRKGGYITLSTKSSSQLQMGTVEVLDEGIGTLPNNPSILTIDAKDPFDYKFMHPGYNPSDAALTNLDTTHIYDMSTNTWVDISDREGFICMVPCVTPSSQTLMIPAMGSSSKDYADGIFKTQQDAVNAVFGLQYTLGHTADRAIYLGQTLIAKIGITDLSNPEDFMTVGVIPQSLAGFTDASGQTGGGSGSYQPLPIQDWPERNSVTPLVHRCNLVYSTSSSQTIINLPTATTPNYLNDFEIQYTHVSGTQGLQFNTGYKWWGGDAPSFIEGNVYTFIAERNGNNWYIGYLTRRA